MAENGNQSSLLNTSKNDFLMFAVPKNGFNSAAGKRMVLILDGSPEFGARVRRNICYLTYLRHLIRSGAITNFLRKYLLGDP